MDDRAELYRRKAADCIRAATLASNTEGTLMYLDLVEQRRGAAEQVEELGERYK
jgi:hypothetical protein